MLCRKFELIPIKFGFLQIFKVAPKSSKSPWSLAKFRQNEKERILHFYIFSDTYTCSHVT